MKERRSVLPIPIGVQGDRKSGLENGNNTHMQGFLKKITIGGAQNGVYDHGEEQKVIKPEKMVEKIYM